jgi:23S rRNA (cytosine1962-C5)-methyltransferase
MELPQVILRKKNRESVRALHPWVYKSDIEKIEGDPGPGDIVCVRSPKNNVIGYGCINRASEIAVRLLSREAFHPNTDFFIQRIKAAFDYRKKWIHGTDAYRVVHSEGDFLPGLIIDRYADTVVAQFLTLGMDIRRDIIVEAVTEVLKPKGIYERSDVHVRKYESLEPKKGWISGAGETEVRIEENGVRFIVDIENGHKTGFYLDQRANRKLIAPYVAGKDVLDCFSYTGSFAVAAAAAGARSARCIDASEDAVRLAARNAELNACADRCRFQAGNVFDELKKYDKEGRRYDVIFLDPPSFTKNKASVDEAYRGYKEINLRALKMLKDGGYLLTSTCSHHVTDEMFRDMLKDAAEDARKTVRVIARGAQAIDHPVVLSIPETEYLKAYLVQVS